MTLRKLCCLTLAAGAVLVGCGDDDRGPSAGDTTTTTTTTSTTTTTTTPEPEPSRSPGSEHVGVGERISIAVLDENGEVVVGTTVP